MADITKCSDSKNCDKKDICYRSIAIDSQWQSYGSFKNECNSENGYPFLWIRGEKDEPK